MIESPVVLLPHPDSPTMPTHSPSSTSKLTPSTATTADVRMRNSVRRFSTCRTGAITGVYSLMTPPTGLVGHGGTAKSGWVARSTGVVGASRPPDSQTDTPAWSCSVASR